MAAHLDAERPPGTSSDRVFVVLKGPRRGQPLSAKGMDVVLSAARRRAGLATHATCHELRHTCLTRLQGRGVASNPTFREKREDTRPALQLPRPSQREGRVASKAAMTCDAITRLHQPKECCIHFSCIQWPA